MPPERKPERRHKRADVKFGEQIIVNGVPVRVIPGGRDWCTLEVDDVPPVIQRPQKNIPGPLDADTR